MHDRRLSLAVVLACGCLVGLLAPGAAVHAQEEASYTQQEIDDYRATLIDVKQGVLDVADVLGDDAYDTVAPGLQAIDGLADEDIVELMKTGADYSDLRDALSDLRAEVVPPDVDLTGDKTGGLPSASYSSICGSSRANSNAIFVGRTVLEVAQIVWSVADRGCNQVVVVCPVPGGGNGSLACTVADAILFAAEAVFDLIDVCDSDIDSAEIEGAYDRLGHLHGDVASLDTKVGDKANEILALDNANRALIVANDNANAAAVVANDDNNAADIINNDNTNRMTIMSNDNTNRDQIIANANANTGNILAELSSLLDAVEGREIENLLQQKKCPAWMYTPPALGGRSARVIAAVQAVIDNGNALQSVAATRLAAAQLALNEAVALAGAGPPLDAKRICEDLIVAYERATPRPPNEADLP